MSDKMREAHWREWAIDGMPKDKQRLADATWQAGYAAALAEQPAPAEQRGEVIPQYRRRGAIEWYDGYADHEDSCGPYEERVVYTAPPAPVVPEGWREFIAECATFAGKMVNGNRLSERAAGLLADAPEVPRG